MNNKKLLYLNPYHHTFNSDHQSQTNHISPFHNYNTIQNYRTQNDSHNQQPLRSSKQIQLQLLKAFDTQMSFGKKQALPTGLRKNKKYASRSVQSNYSSSYRKLQQIKSSLDKLQLQRIKKKTSRNQQYNSKHNTNRSKQSRSSLSSAKSSFHHNKRQSMMSDFFKKQKDLKLVQKLLTIKPSVQVSRKKQLQSYNRHVKAKNIMIHRFQNSHQKKNIVVIKKINPASNASTIVLKALGTIPNKNKQPINKKILNKIQLKQIQLRKLLKQQKRKNRDQFIKKIVKKQQKSISMRPNHLRVKTLDCNTPTKNKISLNLQSSNPKLLPKLRSFSKAQSYHLNNGGRSQSIKSYDFNLRLNKRNQSKSFI